MRGFCPPAPLFLYGPGVDAQKRGSPCVHSFIWIFNALNILNEAAYSEFVLKTTNSQLLDNLNDPEFSKFVN